MPISEKFIYRMEIERPSAEIASTDNTFPIGQIYLTTSTVFQELSSFVEQVKQTIVTPVSVTASSSGDFLMRLSGGGQIYFNQSQPFGKSADNLKALLQTLQSSGPIDVSKIDYIDLRFGDKLYYKMK